ncbi:hypothetical protein [Microbacterium sp. XT11]|uniref:hypothetical protein n=1 Tax=Microbacterium sp. XT11 TaxID=367477 RepID=UPI0012F73170|nr:hypothetical protein [Microbacterium sp. XT11]
MRAVSAAVGLILAVVGVAPAAAADDASDPLISAVMAEVPGGVLLDEHHAVWPELGMQIVAPHAAGQRLSLAGAVGSCGSGLVCVFSSSSLGGAMLSWNTCGYHAIPSSFVARSLADARASGTAHARNGTAVVASAPAGGWTNVSAFVNNVMCYF